MGQRDGRDMGEHEEDLDFTLPTGTTEIGQSKSNLVYQPSSLPPSPEALRTRPLCAISSVLGFSPQRRLAPRRKPQTPQTRVPRVVAGPRGPQAQRRGAYASQPLEGRGRTQREGQGREGRRSRYLAGHHSAASSFSLSGDDPGCGPSAKLRGSRGSCSGEADGWAMSHGYSPFARLALRHHLYAPRLELPCAIGCRVLGDCGVLGCGARRRATPLSREGGGAGRGAGAATSQPGIRPSARPQDREPPPPYELTSGFPVLAA